MVACWRVAASDLQPGCIVHGLHWRCCWLERGLALLVAGEGLALLLVAGEGLGWLERLVAGGAAGAAGGWRDWGWLERAAGGWRGCWGCWWLEKDWGWLERAGA
jgi:hypothetical protein